MKVQDRGNSYVCWKVFDYWKSLAGTISNPTEKADLVEVRFYMHFPVCSLKMVEPNRTDMVFKMFTGPMWFEDPEDYLEETMKQLGSGGWHVILNEVNVHGLLMEGYYSAVDFDKYPVKIDLRTLIRGDKKNEDYIRWLGVNGIKTPWDNPNAREEEEDEMANSDALKVVVDVLKDQSQSAMETTRELADVRVEAAQAEVERAREELNERGDKRASAESESIRLVTDVARDMVSMAREDRHRETNPIEMLKAAVELVRPPADNSGISALVEAVKDSNAKLVEINTKQLEFCQSMVMRKNPDGTWSNDPQQRNSGGIEEELTRFQKLADLFGYQKQGQQVAVQQEREPPQPRGKSFWEGMAEHPVEVFAGITTLMTLGANIVFNLMGGKGNATSPAEALQRTQQPSPTVHPQPQQPQNRDPKDLNSWRGFIPSIEKGIRAHFFGTSNGLNGLSFAQWILSNMTGGAENESGRKAYNSIKANLGVVGFKTLIEAHPPLWNDLKDTPDQYMKFLEDFFTYDEAMEKETV